MAGMVLCEATELYNIINQDIRVSRLSEFNYLCLIDARTKDEYNESHVITARRAKWDATGRLIMPADVEVESLRYSVVYDSNTCSLQDSGPAIECADTLAKTSRHPVHVLKGGYERFSALYPFLRTQKILYTLQELENLQPYPVEILLGQLYMGDYRQAINQHMHKQLKLRALVNVSEVASDVFESSACAVFRIPVADSIEMDLYGFFEKACEFIRKLGTRVEMQNQHEAKPGFVRQLSDWELHTLGHRETDIAEPGY